jgi:serine/threonine-protein kinase
MSDLTGQYLGQYQILARISKGSTSTIYKAYQSKLDRCVAIKVLSPHVVDEEGFLERFTQEARAVAQLDHPNIVPVYDFDQTDDIAYIVFKYVESGTLRSMMTGGPLDLGLAVDIITQVGLALGYAHRRGVIHRDIKPSNILIAEGRWALLTDFGLAKILGGGKQLTRSGIGMGTPDYMSPEQAQGLPGDGRADLYALGVTLYEMLTGRVPFEADSSMGVVVKHITMPPPPPRQFIPDMPEAVEKVILTAMEKDPAKRYQSAEAMIAALVRAAGPMTERATIPSFDLAAASLARPAELQPKPKSLGRWARLKESSTQAAKRIKVASWDKLSRRGRMILSGAVVGCVVLLVAVGSLTSMRLVTSANALPTPTPSRLAAMATHTPAAPSATPSPTPQPTATPSPTANVSPTPSPTPEWTLLPSSAPIRPGIYVKVVRPAGLDVSKDAGFDKEFITTLPVNRILYVLQGPVRVNSLAWIKVTDGTTTGWGVQDYVVTYGIRNTP